MCAHRSKFSPEHYKSRTRNALPGLFLSGVCAGSRYNAPLQAHARKFVMRQEQRFTLLLTTGYLLLAGIIYALLVHEFRLDDSFITYRYARNVADGIGLVYNPGENILSTTAPLYALSLAALSFIISDFHLLGGLFGTVCIAAGGVCITLLLKNLSRWIRAWSGLVYVCATPLWLALGMETPLWIMLVMLAVLLADDERWIFAGGCMGLAMLSRPDAALPGALLGLLALVISIQKRKWQPLIFYGLAAALPVIVFYGWAWRVYGSSFPATLSAKSAQAIVGVTGFGEFTTVLEGFTRILDDLLRQSPLYLITGILLIAGVLKRWRTPALMVILWGILHLLAYILLNTAPYRWYYLPLLPGIILLAAYGLTIISEKFALPRCHCPGNHTACRTTHLVLASTQLLYRRVFTRRGFPHSRLAGLPRNWGMAECKYPRRRPHRCFRSRANWLLCPTHHDRLSGLASARSGATAQTR